MKTLREEHISANREEFLREARLMMTLDHHCIVRLIGLSKGTTLLMVFIFAITYYYFYVIVHIQNQQVNIIPNEKQQKIC